MNTSRLAVSVVSFAVIFRFAYFIGFAVFSYSIQGKTLTFSQISYRILRIPSRVDGWLVLLRRIINFLHRLPVSNRHTEFLGPGGEGKLDAS